TPLRKSRRVMSRFIPRLLPSESIALIGSVYRYQALALPTIRNTLGYQDTVSGCNWHLCRTFYKRSGSRNNSDQPGFGRVAHRTLGGQTPSDNLGSFGPDDVGVFCARRSLCEINVRQTHRVQSLHLLPGRAATGSLYRKRDEMMDGIH